MLSPLERGALTLAMLEDVLDVTLGLTGWETWVISPDEAVLEIAMARGAHAVDEERPPLANAIRQVEEEAEGRLVDTLAVLLPDTPLVTHASLTRALRTLGAVVVVPSADETGTNLLIRRPPAAIEPHFGPIPTADTCRLRPRPTCRPPSSTCRSSRSTSTCRAISSPCWSRATRDGRCRSAATWTSGRGSRLGPRGDERAMAQGTIKDFDLEGVTGSLLMDDSTEVAIDATSLERSGILTLRLGQRVAFDLDEADGKPVARGLRLVTFE